MIGFAMASSKENGFGGFVAQGLGTSGLVGQFGTIKAMGMSGMWGIIILYFLAPVILTLIFSQIMRKKSWIKDGDMALNL